jgi:hypothetical protein
MEKVVHFATLSMVKKWLALQIVITEKELI